MTTHRNRITRYERVPQAGNPARTEAWALIECAKRLADSLVRGPSEGDATKTARKSAVRLNWRLWTIFQAELAQDRPDVPDDIQVQMLTLCNFVDRHTVGALVEPTDESLRVLIDLNRNIASGLMKLPEGAADQQDAADENKSDREKAADPPADLQGVDAEV